MKQQQLQPLLPLYIRLWAIQQALLLHGFQDELTPRWTRFQSVLVALALSFPTRPVPVCCAMAARIAATAMKVPFLHESKYLWLQTDVCFFALLLVFTSSRPSWQNAPISAAAAKELVTQASATIRAQLVLFYVAAGVWKVNSSFLNVHYSCAPVFLLQLTAAYLPQSAQHPLLVLLIGRSAAALTIAVEVGVGLLLWLGRGRRTWGLLGVTLGAMLHLLIAMTPPPNNIGTFSYGCCVRLFLFVPDGACQVAAEIAQLLSGIREFFKWKDKKSTRGGQTPQNDCLPAAACVVAAVFLSTAVTIPRLHAGHPVDIPLLATAAVIVLLLRAVVVEYSITTDRDPDTGAFPYNP